MSTRHPACSDTPKDKTTTGEVLQMKEALKEASVEPNYERAMDILCWLDGLPVDLGILSRRAVARLKSCPDGDVADAAGRLVNKWRRATKERGKSGVSDEARNGTQKKSGANVARTSYAHAAPDRGEKDPGDNGASAAPMTRCVNVKVAHIRPQYRDLAEWVSDSEHNVYIGRRGVVFVAGQRFPPKHSEWCNPFQIKGPTTRKDVIRDYERFIRDKISKDGSLARRLVNELRGKRLGCWCKPEACHGDVLVRLVEEYSKRLGV